MRARLIAIGVASLLVGSALFAGRGYIRDQWDSARAPELPLAKSFTPPSSSTLASTTDAPSVEGGVLESENYKIVSPSTVQTPRIIDPFEVRGSLPDEANLDVPFTIQAPEQQWDLPYEEACEEASVFMVASYYQGKTGRLPIEEAKKGILDIVTYENGRFGDYVHTTAAQTGEIAMDFLKVSDAKVFPIKRIEDIKRLIANGYPVIVPASGRDLGNPNFKAPGPVYHMLVIKGYTKDGKFITNEPGTRKGYNYLYDADVIMNAMHDYSAEDIRSGAKVVLVLFPKSAL